MSAYTLSHTHTHTHARTTPRYNSEHAPAVGINPAAAPTVGVILQKSHINTKDECHYISLIAELEARGARVICIYSGGLDFSRPVINYF